MMDVYMRKKIDKTYGGLDYWPPALFRPSSLSPPGLTRDSQLSHNGLAAALGAIIDIHINMLR
jgi:hypothetical protein